MLSAIVTEIENNRQPDYRDTQDLYLVLGLACQFIEVREHWYSDYVGTARWYYRGKHFPSTNRSDAPVATSPGAQKPPTPSRNGSLYWVDLHAKRSLNASNIWRRGCRGRDLC